MVQKGYHFLFKDSRIKDGIEALLIGDLDTAERTLEAVQSADSNNLVVNYYLAACYTKKGDHKRAGPYYSTVLKIGALKINTGKHFVQHFISKAERALRRRPQATKSIPSGITCDEPSRDQIEDEDEVPSIETPRFRSEDSIISERSSMSELITENQCLLF